MIASRKYGGASPEERREQRRERLIAAGLQEIGTAGYDGTSVQAIAARAGVGDRYFYEHFADRLALLEAVYEHVVMRVLGATTQAVLGCTGSLEARVRAGLAAFVRTLTDDPRLARVQLVEIVGRSAKLEARRAEVMRIYAGFIASTARTLLAGENVPDLDVQMASLALMAGTHQLVTEWMNGTLPVTREVLVDHIVRLYMVVAAARGEPVAHPSGSQASAPKRKPRSRA